MISRESSTQKGKGLASPLVDAQEEAPLNPSPLDPSAIRSQPGRTQPAPLSRPECLSLGGGAVPSARVGESIGQQP